MQAGRALARVLRRRLILSKQGIPYRPSTHWLLGDVSASTEFNMYSMCCRLFACRQIGWMAPGCAACEGQRNSKDRSWYALGPKDDG